MRGPAVEVAENWRRGSVISIKPRHWLLTAFTISSALSIGCGTKEVEEVSDSIALSQEQASMLEASVPPAIELLIENGVFWPTSPARQRGVDRAK